MSKKVSRIWQLMVSVFYFNYINCKAGIKTITEAEILIISLSIKVGKTSN